MFDISALGKSPSRDIVRLCNVKLNSAPPLRDFLRVVLVAFLFLFPPSHSSSRFHKISHYKTAVPFILLASLALYNNTEDDDNNSDNY